MSKMLCIAGYEGDLKKLEILYKAGCDIEINDYDLRTIGHLAAAEGHIEILEFLALRTDYNFNLRDRWENTAMMELKDERNKTMLDVWLNERVVRK